MNGQEKTLVFSTNANEVSTNAQNARVVIHVRIVLQFQYLQVKDRSMNFMTQLFQPIGIHSSSSANIQNFKRLLI